MSCLSREDVRRVTEITSALETVRIGAESAVAELLPAVRELLGADNALFYSLAEHETGWRMSRWHDAGNVGQLGRLLREAIAASPEVIVYYNPRAPAPWMRNRVIEATQALNQKEGEGAWLDKPACRDAFRPAGMERHRHLRALLCDGADLLGLFGTVLPETPHRHHFRLLAALVPAFRRRLMLERRLVESPRTLRAFEVALEEIGAPAFVLDPRGVIRGANAAARALLDERRSDVADAVEAARVGRRHPLGIELTPLRAAGIRESWLAIARVDSTDQRIEVAVTTATERWSLTARQRTVLELILRGDSTVTIAAELAVSARAIEQHVTALLSRAEVSNRAALVAAALTL